MTGYFIDWLNNITGNWGTIVACFIGGGGLITSGIVAVTKLQKANRRHVLRSEKKKNDELKLRIAVTNLQDNVTALSNNLHKLGLQINTLSENVDEKFDAVQKDINKLQQTSDKKDEALKEKIDFETEQARAIYQKIDTMDSLTKLLVESDREDRKAYILKEYYKWKPQKKIYTKSMETLENIFDKYILEDGNSFVAELMSELRELEKVPDPKE